MTSRPARRVVRHVGVALCCTFAALLAAGVQGVGVAGAVTPPPPPSPSRWLAAYYPSYRQDEMPPAEMDFSAVTEVIHWPVVPTTSGGLDTSFGFTAAHSADVVTRAHAAGAKALLGVGGDAASGATTGFQSSAAPARRPAFTNAIVAMVRDRHYDGVDINWEAITDADHANFVAFMHGLRAALNTVTPRPLLTMPPTTGDDGVAALVASVQGDLDQINLQTYVMSGPYPGWVTWFNSPLHDGGFEFPCCAGLRVPSIDGEIARFERAGIPDAKLAIGMQFDAFVWSGGLSLDGLGGVTHPRQSWINQIQNPTTGAELGAPTVTVEPYHTMVTNRLGSGGYVANYDTTAEQPWLSLNTILPGSDTFVSYEDERSIAAKAGALRAHHLGGAFIFEASGDYLATRPAGQRHPLLAAAKTQIKLGYVLAP